MQHSVNVTYVGAGIPLGSTTTVTGNASQTFEFTVGAGGQHNFEVPALGQTPKALMLLSSGSVTVSTYNVGVLVAGPFALAANTPALWFEGNNDIIDTLLNGATVNRLRVTNAGGDPIDFKMAILYDDPPGA
jgi:hypothetical protein